MTVSVRRPTALYVLIAGVVGLIASATLTIERFDLLTKPGYIPSCSINPIISCGNVMSTPQGAVLGFPNPIIGIAAFSVPLVTGVLALAGVRLPRWYWGGLAIGSLVGAIFVHWLIFQSLYRIGALCPYCMVVWSITIPLVVVTASVALRPLGSHRWARQLYQWRWSLVAFWFTGLVLLILLRFWDYWSTLL